LNVFDPQALDTLAHQAFAFIASEREKIQDGSRVNAGYSGSGADAATFNQVLQNTHSLFFGQDHLAEWLWLYLYERLAALLAAIPLLALSVLPKLLGWNVAGLAVHFVSFSEQHKIIKSRKHCQAKSYGEEKKVYCGGIQ